MSIRSPDGVPRRRATPSPGSRVGRRRPAAEESGGRVVRAGGSQSASPSPVRNAGLDCSYNDRIHLFALRSITLLLRPLAAGPLRPAAVFLWNHHYATLSAYPSLS